MKREYHKWHSAALDREMELLVFGHAGKRVLVFPTRKQRFYEYEDHGMIHAARHELNSGAVQFICVDSIDGESLYCFDKEPAQRIDRHLAYEKYIVEEVLPFSESLGKKPAKLAVHGSSFGAFQAMTLALRHPAPFDRVLAFSGRYDLTLNAGDFHTLFHGFDHEALHAINPTHFLPGMSGAKTLKMLRALKITMVCGEDDPFFTNNVAISETMAKKKIPHTLHAWVGNAHRFRYWRQMLRVYLRDVAG